MTALKHADNKTSDAYLRRLVLLDTHAILHRAYHALPDFASSKGEPTGALYGLCTMLIRIINDLKPDHIVACFDLPKPTYRHEVYKDYKAHRAKTDDALVHQLKRARDIFIALNIQICDKEGFEADDMLGTIVEKLRGEKDLDIVVASGDMDTLQLVQDNKVRVFTLKKGINDTVIYNEDAVRARFGFGPELLPDYKGLRGDPSDNIIGIKGIGEKTATTLITTFGTIENMYKVLKKSPEKFKEAGLTDRIIKLLQDGEEEANFSKMLATIRRDAPVEVCLPEESWRKSMDMKAILALFQELEFRTLGARLKSAITGQSVSNTAQNMSEDDGFDQMGDDISSGNQQVIPDISTVNPQDLKRAQLAIWIVDSNKTNPTYEEVMEFTKAKDIKEAITILEADIKKKNLTRVYEEIELPLIPILDEMKSVGVKIDVKYLEELSKEYHEEVGKLEKSIWKHAGKEFNISSPKQLGEVLFTDLGLTIKNAKKTAGGARSTKESELAKLADVHPIINLILQHRELSKLLGTYIDTIPKLVDENNRVHPTLIQTGAATGRMASQDPSIQNIPIKSDLGRKIRHAFIAEKGYSLVAFDYSQIELRVAAFLSKDEKMIALFKSGRDFHTSVAAEVFKVAPEKVDREMRRRAKVINFGIMYGMGVNALRQNLSEGSSDGTPVTRAEAQLFYDEYFKTFSGLAEYLNRVKGEAYRNGFTETFFGRRRYFEGIKSKIPFIKAMAERMAINAPIQGTEADIIKLAMVKIAEHIKKEKLDECVRMLMQVHDELVFEIKNDSVEKVAPDIQKYMETVVDPKDISGIICKAEYKAGKDWGELK
ncbi:MAG: DNA polymerase [Patescibacteria group bacterium]